MADERLRERERQAKLGGLQDRQAWVSELSRTRAPQALEAEALHERIASALEALRRKVDEHFNGFEADTPARPCPELRLEAVMGALETALRDREGMGDVGYGTETLVTYWPREEAHYRSWFGCGVIAFAARLGDAVTLAVNYAVASKPTPGGAWSGEGGLSGWRDSLKPETKTTRLRAWAAAGSTSGFWETLPLASARLAVDLFRLRRSGALEAPAPLTKKGDVTWRGVVRGIQPRLKLQRPHDQDEYFGAGYALRLEGSVDRVDREFVVGVGVAALSEHGFRVGDTVSGVAKHVEDPALVPVDFYRASKLVVEQRGPRPRGGKPPWYGPGPALEDYRDKTPRELDDASLNEDPCRACHWGCRVQVDAVPDRDRPLLAACFGPTSCPAFVPPGGRAGTAKGAAKKTSKKKAKRPARKKRGSR